MASFALDWNILQVDHELRNGDGQFFDVHRLHLFHHEFRQLTILRESKKERKKERKRERKKERKKEKKKERNKKKKGKERNYVVRFSNSQQLKLIIYRLIFGREANNVHGCCGCTLTFTSN